MYSTFRSRNITADLFCWNGGPQPNLYLLIKNSPLIKLFSQYASCISHCTVNFLTSQTFKCLPQNKRRNFEGKKMALLGSIVIPLCSVIHNVMTSIYLPCGMRLHEHYWSSAIRCFEVPVPLSSFWNGKAIITPLLVSLQLFDGIECEFPIFFIYMMIDGKPCSIHSCCCNASSGSLAR